MKSAVFVFRECQWTGWGHFLVSFGLIFWCLRRPQNDAVGLLWVPLVLPGVKNTKFYRYDFQIIFQRSESSQNRIQRCDRRWKFENFENFYFLVFQFPWSILHIHSCPRPIHSARVGSPLASYAFYFVTPSGTGFKHFSVNGLPNKTSSGSVKFQYTIKNENWGVHARP